MATRTDKIKQWEAIRLALFIVTLSIGAGSWMFGRSIGFSRIQDRRHKVLVVEFDDFEMALRAEVDALCATGSIRDVYFDHWDIGLIGILDTTGRNAQCQVVRETPVTSLTVDAMAKCSAAIVKESHLSWNYPGVQQWDLGPVGPQVSRIARWRSSGGSFGFDVYRKMGCDPLGQGAGPAEDPKMSRRDS